MKKVNLKGKLSLKKETIAKLNDGQMHAVKGGTNGHGCPTDLNCSNVCAPTNGCTVATCAICG